MAPRVLVLSVLAAVLAGCSPPQAETAQDAEVVTPAPEAETPVKAVEASRLSLSLNAQGVVQFDDRGRLFEVKVAPCVETSPDECVGTAEVSWAAATFSPAGSAQLPSLYWSAEDSFFAGALRQGHGATGYSIISSDIEGDGVEELLFHTGREGGYGGPSYAVFRWESDGGAWLEAPELSELTVGSTGVFSTDATAGASVWFADGCCRRIGERYAIQDGMPKLIERRTETLAEGKDNEVQVTIETFEGGRLVHSTTETTVAEGVK